MSNCFLILDLNLEARILLLQGNSQIDSFSRLTTIDQFFCFQQMNIDTLYINHSLERCFSPTDQKINCQEIIQSIRQLSYDHLCSPVWPTCTDHRNNSIYFEFTRLNCLGFLWLDCIITHCNFLYIKIYMSQLNFDCRLILS